VLDIDLAGGFDDFGNLGSDSDTIVNASSSGDGNTSFGDTSAMTTADNWATTWDGSEDSTTGLPKGDPTLAHNWQNGPPGTVSHATQVGAASSPDELFWMWRDVTIQPGQTLVFMTTEAMRRNNQETADIATTLDSEPDELYTGMTADELSRLQNWCVQDCDKDGIKNNVDNCPSVANPNQSDVDHDGKGDVCDSDADNDGLSNSTEKEIGTDPLNADTDGDGFLDGQDACPKTKGGPPDGCPATTAAVDKTPPNVTITSVGSASNLADLINGVNVTFTCDELCDGSVRLLGRIPTGSAFLSVAGGFNQTLGRKFISAFTSGSRTVTVKPCQRKPGGPQSSTCLKRLRKAASHRPSFLVKVLVTAQDRAGNRKEASKVIKVSRR
jgi:hypothetical protein